MQNRAEEVFEHGDRIRTEFYIPGTEPMTECNKHTGPGTTDLDTLGRATDTFSRAPGATLPPAPQVRVAPGASPVPRAAPPRQDTSHSRTVFDTTTRPRPKYIPPRDTSHGDSLRLPRPR